MRHENGFSPPIENRCNRGQCHPYPTVVGDVARVVLGHVEVNPYQKYFVLGIDIRNGFLWHLRWFLANPLLYREIESLETLEWNKLPF